MMANPHSALIREWEEAKAKGMPMEWSFIDTRMPGDDHYAEVWKWERDDPEWFEHYEYRIRPIPLRQLEVILKHEPMTEEPEVGTVFWEPYPVDPEAPTKHIWGGGLFNKKIVADGLCYATAEGAIERGWAMRRTGRT